MQTQHGAPAACCLLRRGVLGRPRWRGCPSDDVVQPPTNYPARNARAGTHSISERTGDTPRADASLPTLQKHLSSVFIGVVGL